MPIAEFVSTTLAPKAPRTLKEAGLNRDLVAQLLLKTLHLSGELSGTELSRRLGLPFFSFESVLAEIKQQHHCEVSGGALGSPSYLYRITDAGRARAMLFMEHNHYVGRAPVPLSQYREYMYRFQSAARRQVDRESVREAFSHLVLNDRVRDQLGPAINAGHSMFVYGPPGNGKTVISQAIHNLLEGSLYIPHALEVEGSIIGFFDPVNHEPLPESEQESLDLEGDHDHRWILCRRPRVMVGGELSLAQLELSYNPVMGFYRAPVQAVANGGVLVIDDFGRQTCSPRDLLNRWIVPLESRVDFLTLQTGQKFDLPFMTLIVFATNIKPQDLVDEAFLRRIHYKIFAESPTRAEFLQIFENCCREKKIAYRHDVVERLLAEYYRPRQIQLRGCHPRDLIEQAIYLAEYLGQPPELTTEVLEAACASYFVDDRESEPTYA
ncbi:MAG TPA: ATP-binding protein [Vicinamibacterales bacterium]|nr:ATP-binding protein [Vicinamibacterales bacterium]